MNRLFQNPLRIFLIIFVVTLTGIFLLKSIGFHIQDLRLVRGGSVLISPLDENTKVFLDNKKVRIQFTLPYGRAAKNVIPGDHTFLVFKSGHWPWVKNITIVAKEESRISPFLISKNVSGIIITENDDEYGQILNAINENIVPREETALLSYEGNVKIWVSGNAVMAEWVGDTDSLPYFFCTDDFACEGVVEVVNSQTELRNISFYKDREDIVIIASQNGIFAIEIDKRGTTQNFQPIYKGASLPRFAVKDTETLYIRDGSVLFIVSI